MTTRRGTTRPAAGAALAVAALAAALLAAGPAVGQGDVRPLPVVSVDTSQYPLVQVVVAAPAELGDQVLGAEAFSVTEAGESRIPQVAGLATEGLEVAVVVDTSGSMSGEPMTAAKAAALALLRQLPESVPVAVVSFGATAAVVAPRSTDRAAQLAAVDGLRAGGETALYDGIVLALDQLDAGAASRPAVVVLSDGHDTVSAATVNRATGALAGARALFAAVELRTPESDTAALERMARATGGRVVAAGDPTALEGLFEEIGRELVRQYALSWETSGRGEVTLAIVLETGGIRAETQRALVLPATPPPAPPSSTAPQTLTPTTPRPEPKAVGPAPGDGNLWDRWGLTLGAIIVAAGMLGILSTVLVQSTPRSRALDSYRPDRLHDTFWTFTEKAGAAADKVLTAGGMPRLGLALDRAGIDLRPGEFVLTVGGGAAAAMVVGWLASSVALGLILAAVVILMARVVVARRIKRRCRLFDDQLADTLQLVAGTLRAGYGLSQALDTVSREAQSPSREEFRRVVVETRLGRDLADSMRELVARMHSRDLEWVVEAFEIHAEVGGDLAEVLDTVAATMRDRTRVRRQINVLAAEGKLSGIVLTALPPGVAVMMAMTNPGYLRELVDTRTGNVMLAGAVVLVSVGAVWLSRIVKPDY